MRDESIPLRHGSPQHAPSRSGHLALARPGALCAVLGLCGLATPAAAGTNELSIGSTTRALRSSSANAVTADDLEGGTLTLGHALDLPVVPGLTVWADAGLSWGHATGTMFQTLWTEIGSTTWTAGGRARYAVVRHLWASARLDLGLARASLALSDTSGHAASDHGWSPLASGALGLDLLAVERPRYALGLRLELGYVSAAAIPLVAAPTSGSAGTLQLQMTAASLGHLDLSGPSFTVSLMAQF